MQTQSPRPITPHAILSAKISELEKLLSKKNPDSEVMELIENCKQLAQPLDAYLSEHSTEPSEPLNELERATNEIDWKAAYKNGETAILLEQEMVSGAVEGQLLNMLVAITGAKRVLEIGSFTGYATLAMAEALPENGKIIACEYDSFAADFARKQYKNNPNRQKIEIKEGDAITTINKLQDTGTTFDLVFIDADKVNYGNYYRTIMDTNLVNKGGLICVDNTLYMGEVYGAGEVSANGKAIDLFNRMVKNDERVQQVLLPLRDGLTIIRRIK